MEEKKIDYASEFLKRVPNEWLAFFNVPSVKAAYDKVISSLVGTSPDELCPVPSYVFEAFRWTKPQQVRVVIFGQDPYPRQSDAHGLAFSSMDQKTPASLRNIYTALITQKLIKDKPNTNCLSAWAAQGVLLLNTAFTTIADKPGTHVTWHDFTLELINILCKWAQSCNQRIIFALWGKHAQQFIPIIQPPVPGKDINEDTFHLITTYQHPVARGMSWNQCPSFQFVANNDVQINWDADASTYVEVFTDGSAILGDSSGWSCLFTKGLQKPYVIYGKDNQKKITNQIAEGNAIYVALNFCKQTLPIETRRVIKIYSDSMFWIDMIYTYMPKWSDAKFAQMANPELTKPLWDLYLELSTESNIILEHVPSHNKKGWLGAHSYLKYLAQNNARADKLASLARTSVEPGKLCSTFVNSLHELD